MIEQVGCTLEEALGEAHAARMRVEQEHRGVEATGAARVKIPTGSGERAIPAGEAAVPQCLPEVTWVAHHGERRHGLQRAAHAAQAIDHSGAGVGERGQHGLGQREPKARGVHLHLGQMHVPVASVLVGEELDLLVAGDLLHHFHVPKTEERAAQLVLGALFDHAPPCGR